MDLNLDGSVGITLASSDGLGKACAAALAREGADVVVNGRTKPKLLKAVKEIEAVASGRVYPYQGDITNPDEIEGLVKTTVDEFGRLDHLVTSAGGPPRRRFQETTDREWYDAYELLVMSVVRTVRHAADLLKANGGGSVVNVTSVAVREANPDNVLSSSVRMAVIGLQKVLATELGPSVRVNSVLPGGFESPRVRNAIMTAVKAGEVEDATQWRAQFTDDVPIDRLGETCELGDTVAFLCSDRAGYINGETISVDGGWSRATL